MIQIFSLCLTGLLALYVVYSRKQYGVAKACALGMGFFAVAIYLDSIFSLIMRNAAVMGQGSVPKIVFQLMGLFISKSILVTGVMVGMIRQDLTDGFPEKLLTGKGRSRHTGQRQKGWQYPDGLTAGAAVFFVVLAWDCMRSGRDDFSMALRMVFLLLVLLGYYISLFIYRRKQRALQEKAENETQRHEAGLYLRNIEDQYQRTRELWHDLKNHINLLSLLLEEGRYGEMTDYLRIFGEKVDGLTLPFKSGNLVVDALLADKAARAKKENVPMQLSLCNLAELPLGPDEICGFLGNLLDNALEASRLVEEGKFILVESREREDWYYIKVQNAVRGAVGEKKADEGRERLCSGKSDRRNRVGHGLGLRSAERIVHGCGGELMIDSGEKWFTVVVRLPK